METRKIDLKGLKEEEFNKAMDEAALIIKKGGLVAFPTETVYGLGADGLNEAAVEKIFLAKGRPKDNPLILHIASKEEKDLLKIVKRLPKRAKKLMDIYWPGPLTIILKSRGEVPERTRGGLDTVGIRMPDNIIAKELIIRSGRPIAAPSANISGRPSPTSYKRCLEDLDGKVDMILGWDVSRVGIESTIVDLSDDDKEPLILRPGAITYEDIKDTLKEVKVENIETLKGEESPRAPGMKYTHYSPRARVLILKGEKSRVLEYFKENYKPGARLIVFGKLEEIEANKGWEGLKDHIVVRKTLEEGIHEIFEDLRESDDRGYGLIYIEAQEERGLGLGLMNRVKKAAGFNIVEV